MTLFLGDSGFCALAGGGCVVRVLRGGMSAEAAFPYWRVLKHILFLGTFFLAAGKFVFRLQIRVLVQGYSLTR